MKHWQHPSQYRYSTIHITIKFMFSGNCSTTIYGHCGWYTTSIGRYILLTKLQQLMTYVACSPHTPEVVRVCNCLCTSHTHTHALTAFYYHLILKGTNKCNKTVPQHIILNFLIWIWDKLGNTIFCISLYHQFYARKYIAQQSWRKRFINGLNPEHYSIKCMGGQ